ncbi:hypothetical protein GCM10027517_21340 [Phycicoccus ginsengisoli]
MELLGARFAGQDLVKILPGLLAVVAAALRLVPNVVTSARGRRSHALSGRSSQLHVSAYAAPPPFSAMFARRYDPAADDLEAQVARHAMRARTLRVCASGMVATTVLTAAYLIYGVAIRPLPNWSLAVAVIIGAAVDLPLARTFRAVRRDPARGSAAKTQEGHVLVAAPLADALQHTLAALIEMGARLVGVEGSRVLAATGVSFGKDMWLGEVIWVTLSDGSEGNVRVVIRSTKADFVSRSRSRRNVVTFLESWASFPGAAQGPPAF